MRPKRFFLWSGAALVGVVGAAALFFKISVFPSVWLIRYSFSKGAAAVEGRLAKHVPPGVDVAGGLSYGPEKLDIYRPHGGESLLPVVVWVHGGGWIGGSKDEMVNYYRILAAHGVAVVPIDYTVAPAARYPTPVVQLNQALGYLVAHATMRGLDMSRVIVGGDSAGAQIGAQEALVLSRPDYAQRMGVRPALAAKDLRGVLLLSGAFNFRALHAERLHGVYRWFIRTVFQAYTGSLTPQSTPLFGLASVTDYVNGQFPPTFITSGNGDPLAPQAVDLAEKLERDGVPIEAHFYPPSYTPVLPHEFQFDLDRPEAAESFARMTAFIARHVTRDPGQAETPGGEAR